MNFKEDRIPQLGDMPVAMLTDNGTPFTSTLRTVLAVSAAREAILRGEVSLSDPDRLAELATQRADAALVALRRL